MYSMTCPSIGDNLCDPEGWERRGEGGGGRRAVPLTSVLLAMSNDCYLITSCMDFSIYFSRLICLWCCSSIAYMDHIRVL